MTPKNIPHDILVIQLVSTLLTQLGPLNHLREDCILLETVGDSNDR